MQIRSFKIGGFRNISSIIIEMNNFTSLVALNGYGKSNVIDALDFGIKFIHEKDSLRNIRMGQYNDFPLLEKNANSNFIFGIEIQSEFEGKECIINYSYEFEWIRGKSEGKIVQEVLSYKINEKYQRENVLINRDDKSAKYKPSKTARCSKNIYVSNFTLVLTKLMQFDELFFESIIKDIFDVSIYVNRHVNQYVSENIKETVLGSENKELDFVDMENIPRLIYFIKENYFDKYELLINAFKLIFPDIIDINVKAVSFENSREYKDKLVEKYGFEKFLYFLIVKKKNLIQDISFFNLSVGTKRVFMLLTYAIISDIKKISLLVIEEPENSIHPSLLQSYLSILNQLTGQSKILLASHSPYIIKYLNPSNIYIGLPNSTDIAEFVPILPNKVKTLCKEAASYDQSVGDYIFELMSNDEDINILKGYVDYE